MSHQIFSFLATTPDARGRFVRHEHESTFRRWVTQDVGKSGWLTLTSGSSHIWPKIKTRREILWLLPLLRAHTTKFFPLISAIQPCCLPTSCSNRFCGSSAKQATQIGSGRRLEVKCASTSLPATTLATISPRSTMSSSAPIPSAEPIGRCRSPTKSPCVDAENSSTFTMSFRGQILPTGTAYPPFG